jgi:hypothetical protein
MTICESGDRLSHADANWRERHTEESERVEGLSFLRDLPSNSKREKRESTNRPNALFCDFIPHSANRYSPSCSYRSLLPHLHIPHSLKLARHTPKHIFRPRSLSLFLLSDNTLTLPRNQTQIPNTAQAKDR